jgi:NADH-quinone oxidoreductase subunit L
LLSAVYFGAAVEEGHHHEEHHGLAPGQKPHESPWVVTLPLILLAIPSVIIGYLTIGPMLFGEFFGSSILVDAAKHPAMKELSEAFNGPFAMVAHALHTPVLYLAVGGVVTAAVFYLWLPQIPAYLARVLAPVKKVLDNKYYLDDFNQAVFAKGARVLGNGLWKGADQKFIDGFLVNGSANLIGWFSSHVRKVQSGFLYHYAFAMILGLIGLISWVLLTHLGSVK